MEILFENRQIVLACKPVGMPCQPDPGGDEDFLSALSAACGTELYLVHRLDRTTGGVMAFAKTKQSAAKLSEIFARHTAEKTYLAVTEHVPEPPEGELCDFLYFDARQGKSFAVPKERRGAKEARLRYRMLDTAVYGGREYALLSVTLLTGRTHQIRAQFSAHGWPLAGDGKYGGRDNTVKGTKTALWAYSLTLPASPFWGGEQTVSVRPPEEEPWTRFTQGLMTDITETRKESHG